MHCVRDEDNNNNHLGENEIPVKYDSGLGAELLTAYRATLNVLFVNGLVTLIVLFVCHQVNSFCIATSKISCEADKCF